MSIYKLSSCSRKHTRSLNKSFSISSQTARQTLGFSSCMLLRSASALIASKIISRSMRSSRRALSPKLSIYLRSPSIESSLSRNSPQRKLLRLFEQYLRRLAEAGRPSSFLRVVERAEHHNWDVATEDLHDLFTQCIVNDFVVDCLDLLDLLEVDHVLIVALIREP